MAALKKWKHIGLDIEMWETSFRVNGSLVLHMGEYANTDTINSVVDAIYDSIYQDARKDAMLHLAEKSYKDTLERLKDIQ